ncbi:tRNA lysidine(34) synthetase TilS [bacterium]|nr:tRNA lysidine(34) synthetase TilS [bacterium]
MSKQKLLKTIQDYRMISKGDRLLVGVSGGPDSVALLYLLMELRDIYNLQLYIVHLNHMLRGSESDEDAGYVRRLAKKMKLPVFIGKKDVGKFAKANKLSLEEAARIQRYEFYEQIAEKLNIRKIALGHTADDNAETVLMRLLRGAGEQGLTGIYPVRYIGNLKVIRPLLNIYRVEIEAFLKEKKIRARTDSSNADNKFLRNKVRLELIPLLEENYNQNIKQVLINTADILKEDNEYLMQITEKFYNEAHPPCPPSKPRTEPRTEFTLVQGERNLWFRAKGEFSDARGGSIHLSIKKIADFPLAIQRRVIRYGIKELTGTLRQITYQHLNEIFKLLKGNLAYGRIDLPDGLVVERMRRELVIRRGKARNIRSIIYPVKIPGETVVSELGVKLICAISKRKANPKFYTQNRYQEYLDYNKIKKPVFIRTRKQGDTFQPLGMKGKKKIKDFLIDQKIPQPEKRKVLLLTDKTDIIWLIGFRISDKFKVTEKTKQVLKVRFLKIKKGDIKS